MIRIGVKVQDSPTKWAASWRPGVAFSSLLFSSILASPDTSSRRRPRSRNKYKVLCLSPGLTKAPLRQKTLVGEVLKAQPLLLRPSAWRRLSYSPTYFTWRWQIWNEVEHMRSRLYSFTGSFHSYNAEGTVVTLTQRKSALGLTAHLQHDNANPKQNLSLQTSTNIKIHKSDISIL